MKRRYLWAATLLAVLLLMVAASCAPAATSTPTAASNPAPGAPLTSPHVGGRRGTSGTLTRIDGYVLTLTTSQGSVMVNIIADNTTVQNVTKGTPADLHEGQYLIAMGSQDAGGTVTAASIMIQPQFQGTPTTFYDGARSDNASPRGGFPRGGGGRRGASGTLTRVDGKTLTLTNSQGTATPLIISDNTTIQNFTTGTFADLHEGQYLNVTGPQAADGSVTATSIIIQPPGQGAPPPPPPGA